MDGLSATVGIPLGGHLQLRGNYSIGVPDQVYPLQYTIPDLGTYNISGKQVSLKDITLKGDLTKNLNVMADLYLSKKGGFHITIGVSGILDPKILSISSELREIALIVILFRAGLSLDVSDMKKIGRPAIMLCFVPASSVRYGRVR